MGESENNLLEVSGENYEAESRALSAQVIDLIDKLCGQHEWSGDHPFTIDAVDTGKKTGFRLEIRRGDDWITIAHQDIANPRSVIHYNFSKKNHTWEYVDRNKIKYGESNLPAVREILEMLRKVEESRTPKKLS